MIRASGFGATSVSEIARAVGVTKAGLYHYIESKEALLAEVLSFGMDQVDAEVIATAATIGNPEARLRHIVTRHAAIVTRAHGAVAQLVDEVPRLPAASRRRIEKRMRAYVDLLRDTLRELEASGRLRDIDITVAAFSILGMIHWMSRWFRPEGRLGGAEVAEQIADLALGGLLTRTDGRRRAPGERRPVPGARRVVTPEVALAWDAAPPVRSVSSRPPRRSPRRA